MNAEKLKTQMEKLPEPVSVLKAPFWEYWRYELWRHVMQGDDPARFFSWPCIYHTMLVNHWKEAVWYEYMSLLTDAAPSFEAVWEKAILMPPIGNDYQAETEYSRNLIHQAYHIQQFLQTTGITLTELCRFGSIIEIGGGYGAMALVLQRLGYQGKVILYDWPEFLLLQRYFLSACNADMERLSFISSLSTLRIHVKHADMMIGCYSLSEMPYEQREQLLKSVGSQRYLFLYSDKFEQYDNRAFFIDYAHERNDLEWQHTEIGHLPDSNWYSFGAQ